MEPNNEVLTHLFITLFLFPYKICTFQDIVRKMEWARKLRNDSTPTVPSTIGEEKLINPFMRVNEPSVQQHVNKTDAVQTMAAIRKEKDNFKA